MKFDGRKEDEKEHVWHSLDSMGAFSYNDTLHLKEFSYTWYANLRPGSTHKFEHLVSLLNTKFFHPKVKLSLAELDCVHRYPWEDLNTTGRRFDNRAFDVTIL